MSLDKLPERWLTKNNIHVREYLAKKYNEPDILHWEFYTYVGFTHANYNNGCLGTNSSHGYGATEISFDDFKRLVLKEPTQSNDLFIKLL